MRFILYCGFHARLRRREISKARISWSDLEAGLLHVSNDSGFTSKDTENRVVTLTKEFLEFLQNYTRGMRSQEFALQPERLPGVWKYRYDFKRLAQSHFNKCGVVLDLHSMRRSFASNLVSDGVSIYKVAQCLGDGVEVVEGHYGYQAIDRLVA